MRLIANKQTKNAQLQLVETHIKFFIEIKVIIDIIITHPTLLYFILRNKSVLLISKLWLFLYYFPSINQKFFNSFKIKTNRQIKRSNSKIKLFFSVLI